jgi:hypothetical protein
MRDASDPRRALLEDARLRALTARAAGRLAVPAPSAPDRAGTALAVVRTATVATVSATGTVGLTAPGGQAIAGVPYLDPYIPRVGDVVLALVNGTSWTVLGLCAPARPPFVRGVTAGTTDGSAQLVFTHGLGVIPTSVLVTPQAPQSGANIFSQFVVDTYTATTARVRAFRPPGTGINSLSITFSWLAVR